MKPARSAGEYGAACGFRASTRSRDDGPFASPVPVAGSRLRKTIEEAMEACIATARPDNGNWPSEVQVKTAISLRIHVIGQNVPIDTLTQAHIGSVVDLMRALPNRWGRTADEISGGVAASLERAKTLPRAQLGIANATLAKHLTWLHKVVKHAKRHANSGYRLI